MVPPYDENDYGFLAALLRRACGEEKRIQLRRGQSCSSARLNGTFGS